MLSSAEPVISFGPMGSSDITERLLNLSLRLLRTSKECVVELVEVP